MRVRIDITKSLEENAESYFKKAKKARKKLQGAKQAHAQAKQAAKKASQQAAEHARKQALKKPEERWYHKYRWSKTRNGHLLVAGQNASANEALIKQHTQPNNLVLHTDMAGSPFTLLQPLNEQEITEEDLQDAAQLTAAYSKAWQKGLAALDVFHVKPDQVTKQAQSGEYLTKGSFMIRGDTTYHHPTVELAIGVIMQEGYHPQIFVGSQEACEKHCAAHAVLRPGQEKTSDVAKQLQKRFGGALDSYVKAIPAGGTRITDKGMPLQRKLKKQRNV